MAPRDLSKTLQRALTHLQPPPTKGGKFAMPIPSHFRPAPKFVQVKDRVPFWHIAPNDKVVVVKGSEDVRGQVGTVDSVDRASNRVYLKEPIFKAKKRQPTQYPGEALEPTYSGGDAQGSYYTARPFHLSNLRLQVESKGDTFTATRVRRTAVTWDRKQRRFAWKRFGLVKEVEVKQGAKTPWVEIPWPSEEVVASSPTPLDAPLATASRASWTPSLSALTTLASASPAATSVDLPAELGEVAVTQLDLSGGYHSRAARTARFNEQKALAKEQGKAIRANEIKARLARKKGEEEWVDIE